MQNGYIQKLSPHLSQDLNEKIELIIIDGASTDGTREFLTNQKVKFHTLENSTRLARLKYGLKLATQNKIILHHPRSILEANAFKELIYTNEQWGGFTHRFDIRHPLLNFTSFYSNFIRGDIKSIFYFDHCIYLDKNLKDLILNLEDREIFEDTEISLILKQRTKGKRLKASSTTSAIRFLSNGIYRQAYLNQKMKWLYYKKHNHKLMNKEYEKDMNLNNETK